MWFTSTSGQTYNLSGRERRAGVQIRVVLALHFLSPFPEFLVSCHIPCACRLCPVVSYFY